MDLHRGRRGRNFGQLRNQRRYFVRFLRLRPERLPAHFRWGLGADSANLTVNAIYDKESEGVALVIRNHSSSAEKVSIFDAYSGKTRTHLLHAHDSVTYVSQLYESLGWYDLTIRVDSDASFQRQLAGHVETGRPSVTDPAIAASYCRDLTTS